MTNLSVRGYSTPGRARRYPVAQFGRDARFTLGLVLDVAAVLEQHGYPPLSGGGADVVELRQALFAFLYTGGGGEQR